jgi:DNA repair protein RecO (recombination protein O)
MLHKTKGIALGYIRYRETSIIAKIYTEAFGIQSYIVNGVRSSKSKTNRIALFQPLTLLDMVVYHQGKEDGLNRISEMKCYMPFAEIPYERSKLSIALFVTEMLAKTLHEEESNEELFAFLAHSITYLDEAKEGYENFHIQFLMQYAMFLGFGIESMEDLDRELNHHHFPRISDETEIRAAEVLLRGNYGIPVRLDRQRRVAILEKVLFFYHAHMTSLGTIRSLEVLKEIMK